jgi:hypothetical protein
LLGALSACSSIHIKTGPPTDEETMQQSEEQGRRFRVTWTDRLQKAGPVDRTEMMRGLLDTTTSRYLGFGHQIADWWRDENDRRGAEIPVEQVRPVVERSSQFDLPLLDAYEDVLEYGVQSVVEEKFFDDTAEQALIQYRDYYLEVYSAVFFPNGSLEEFRLRLQTLEAERDGLTRELSGQIDRYR